MNFNQFQINPKAIIFHCVSAEGGGSEYSEMAEKLFINMLLSQFGKKTSFRIRIENCGQFYRITLPFVHFSCI